MLKLDIKSLEWSLENIMKYGDTDIFPLPIEFRAIYADKQKILGDLAEKDITAWKVRPYRNTIMPKHEFGFRIATQLDPLDSIVFNALVYEISDDIENKRVSIEDKVVFSARVKPENDGTFFNREVGWRTFQETSEELINEYPNGFVVVADIADFFPRIAHHSLENALSITTSKNLHVKSIFRFLRGINSKLSYGVPVGPVGPRLLAELAISDIDDALILQGIRHIRFVDDFRIFCKGEIEAYEALSLLAKLLYDLYGLTLQQHKTEIISVEKFAVKYLTSDDDKELESFSSRFYKILEDLGIEDVYEGWEVEDLSEEALVEINNLNLVQMLEEQLISEKPVDSKIVKFILNRLAQLNNHEAIDLCVDYIDKLYVVITSVFRYFDTITGLDSEVKNRIGERLISILDSSKIGHLEFHRLWIFNNFAKDPEWNNSSKYIPLYNKYSDVASRRKITLALSKSSMYHWFKLNKKDYTNLSPWEKRAFIVGASCLPGDEYKHWIQSIKGSFDLLDETCAKWAQNNKYNE